MIMLFRVDKKERWIPLEQSTQEELFMKLRKWSYHYPAVQLIAAHVEEINLTVETTFAYEPEVDNIIPFPGSGK
jgi:hypothetical protein